MGRKVKERAFEEEGEAKKLPSSSDIKKYVTDIITARATLKQSNADAKADIRSMYDSAVNAGIDKDALKMAIKIIESEFTDELKMMTNIVLEKSGQYAFFHTGESLAA